MFCDQMRASIEAARTPARLESLARAIWQAWAVQAVSDDDAEHLAGLIHARETAARGEREPVGRVSRPTLDLPAQAAATGSCALRSDRAPPPARRLGADAAWARRALHDGRT